MSFSFVRVCTRAMQYFFLFFNDILNFTAFVVIAVDCTEAATSSGVLPFAPAPSMGTSHQNNKKESEMPEAMCKLGWRRCIIVHTRSRASTHKLSNIGDIRPDGLPSLGHQQHCLRGR